MDRCITLTPIEQRTVSAIFDRLFPADETGPGATEIGAVVYLDRALGGWVAADLALYRSAIPALNRTCQTTHAAAFADLAPGRQDETLRALEAANLPGMVGIDQAHFFRKLLAHCQEGCFSDPLYGGNRDKAGWKAMGHSGVWLSNSAADHLSATPVDHGGQIKSLADVQEELAAQTSPDPVLPGFDPERSTEAPTSRADVVLIGVGAVGALIAPILARAGLQVVGLEAGPVRSLAEYIPDELGATYYCRQNLGPKFMAEEPRWRRDEQSETEDPTYSLGRMMNNAGGSVIHYGAWLRRFHPHQFHYRTHILERWGE
ncbi:MAG TPA: gluconate 2-dehydrogenase subunit 3 family protein, partial [Thermomicrobiales bacterium]|nr:gluconate 2-dehydrogenase subunit 3 family protein [Thermomicrobiales bacterium]